MREGRKYPSSVGVNIALLLAVVAVFVCCVALGRSPASPDGGFVGTDTAAVESIARTDPGYEPWFHSVFSPPSAEIESGLFALQAAVGAGVFGYVLGAMRRRRPRISPVPSASDEPR
ncbi:energy-coupling factor ABC transporter substrate-binding protein [Mycolicibacterium palauense]|uniref:energy-coupling factor ABC transporter substrate-binding protein n=1 Tax=Mycolicibacterium palauense TaxID=2034511 RepID=UPI000BFEC065|nr:energy-coupling factor ABC transporter substrate-binding protein [Mycolicibacterium palauense]